MEKWKIAVIAALLLSLVGFGMFQQSQDGKPTPTPAGTPIPSPYIGKTLPKWNFKQWSGTPVAFESLKGKKALVEIFRINCPHCQDAAPFMVTLKNRYGPRGLNVVAIQSPGAFDDPQNTETNWMTVDAWIKERKLNYPVAMDSKSAYFQGTIQKEIFKGDGSQMLYPTTLIVDEKGKIISAHTGFQTTKQENIAKIIDLAVELEKLFPGSKSPAENAASLMGWLKPFLPEIASDTALVKALTDDIAERLKK